MKKVLAVFALVAVVAFAAPSAFAARRVHDITAKSVGMFNNTRTVAPTLVVSHSAAVKNVTVSASTYTGSNSVTSVGDQADTTITTSEADSSTTTDDLANSSTSLIAVESQNTGADSVYNIDGESSGSMVNDDAIAGSDSTTQNVDNANASAALSHTGANTVYAGGTLNRTIITTAVGNSASSATTTFSVHSRTISRVVVP